MKRMPQTGTRRSTLKNAKASMWICSLLIGAGFIAAVPPPAPVTIIAVGDIMLSRNVASKMRNAGDPLLPFRNVSGLLSSSDLNFGNLESPFEAIKNEPDFDGPEWDGIIGGKSLVFAAPNRSIGALERFNFRIVSMANNHAMDQGTDGLVHTLGRLSAVGIQVAGAGATLEEAWRPRTVEVRGIKVGVIAVSYASLNYGTDERNDYVARMQDLDRLKAGLHALRLQADFVLVAMHAGDEYTAEPNPAQQEVAHAAIDAGADVVIGSHPHWIQPVERYKEGLIFYSLGNFVFDLDSSPATRIGAAVKLAFIGNRGIVAEIYPVAIENSCCARPAREDEIARVMRSMRINSLHLRVERGRT